MLVLDEGTSSLDLLAEAVIQRVIREEFEGCTVIAIAHRLDTIADFDLVAVLDRGSLVEIGPPRELLARQSAFRDLYMSQHSENGQDI